MDQGNFMSSKKCISWAYPGLGNGPGDPGFQNPGFFDQDKNLISNSPEFSTETGQYVIPGKRRGFCG